MRTSTDPVSPGYFPSLQRGRDFLFQNTTTFFDDASGSDVALVTCDQDFMQPKLPSFFKRHLQHLCSIALPLFCGPNGIPDVPAFGFKKRCQRMAHVDHADKCSTISDEPERVGGNPTFWEVLSASVVQTSLHCFRKNSRCGHACVARDFVHVPEFPTVSFVFSLEGNSRFDELKIRFGHASNLTVASEIVQAGI